MNILTITISFWVSLVLGLGLGVYSIIWWARKGFKNMVKDVEEQYSINHASFLIFIKMIPGLIFFIVCCIPVMYFNGLISQHGYCINVVKVNSHIEKDHKYFQKGGRCDAFDVNELFEKAGR